MISLTRRYCFPAAHILSNPALSADENLRIYGKCANVNGHGHDYGLEVTVSGTVDPMSGQLVSVALLDSIVEEEVLPLFRYRLLNEQDAFQNAVPTAENIAQVLFRTLRDGIARCGGVTLRGIRLQETSRNNVEYAQDQEIR